MPNQMDQHRELTLLLFSLRRSVEDRPPHRIGTISNAQWRRALLALEEVRVILRQSARRGGQRPIDIEMFEEAHEKLLEISSDAELMEILGNTKLVPTIVPKQERALLEPYRGLPGSEGIYVALDLSSAIASAEPKQFDLQMGEALRRLERIVPEQKVSPAKFGIVDQKVVVLPQSHAPGKADIENATNARIHLHGSGARIIDALRNSNCDRRLIEGLEAVQAKLEQNTNVIELGLANLGCEAMCSMAKAELPDALCGMIQGHTTAVAMYVAQFPDWQRFAENAASADLDASDVEEINRAASQIITHIQDRPEIADSEVPKTIRAIRRLTADPATTMKKAAFALLRTVENFVATVFGFGAEFLTTTAKKTSDKVSDAVSRAAVIALMSAALAGASQMTGVSAHIAEAGWIKNAVEIVQQQISKVG